MIVGRVRIAKGAAEDTKLKPDKQRGQLSATAEQKQKKAGATMITAPSGATSKTTSKRTSSVSGKSGRKRSSQSAADAASTRTSKSSKAAGKKSDAAAGAKPAKMKSKK